MMLLTSDMILLLIESYRRNLAYCKTQLISSCVPFLLLPATKCSNDEPLRFRIQCAVNADLVTGNTPSTDLPFCYECDVAPVGSFLCFLFPHHGSRNKMQSDQDRVSKRAYVYTRHRNRSCIRIPTSSTIFDTPSRSDNLIATSIVTFARRRTLRVWSLQILGTAAWVGFGARFSFPNKPDHFGAYRRSALIKPPGLWCCHLIRYSSFSLDGGRVRECARRSCER